MRLDALLLLCECCVQAHGCGTVAMGLSQSSRVESNLTFCDLPLAKQERVLIWKDVAGHLLTELSHEHVERQVMLAQLNITIKVASDKLV